MYNTKANHKIIAVFLTLNFLTTLLPINQLYASNSGPNAPEVAGFEPVDATDMVNLSSGNLSYNLPLLDVGGFPISMAYHAGIPSSLDASWVGLGWYLNTGAINRQQIAVPDDWKSGKSINFISFKDSETKFEIGGGYTDGMTYAGVGISWGSNQSLGGYVEAGIGLIDFGTGSENSGLGIGGSIDTNGNYYIGAYSGINATDNVGIGASLGITSQGFIASATAGYNIGSSKKGMGSLGISFNSQGSFSIGASGGKNFDNNAGFGGAGLSMGSFSSGDYDIKSKSLGGRIPLVFIPAYIKIGRTKNTFSLRKGYVNTSHGAMYSAITNRVDPIEKPDLNFADYNHRYNYMDVYEQTLPQTEGEFISDYKSESEKLNFTFIGYDQFEVQANGIGGRLKPRILENITLYNRGLNTPDSEVSNRRKHVFYHNSGLKAYRDFGSGNHEMNMYFDGTFSDIEKINPSNVSYTGSSINDLVTKPLNSGSFKSNPFSRPTTASFVEVFSNKELASQNVPGELGISEPESLPFSLRNNKNIVDPDGIGAYKIVSPDGKTYHFTVPVYQFEKVKRNLLKTSGQIPNDAHTVSEDRQYSKYATHWLLTAVTGPDYLDVNSNGKVDEGDYGYWIRLDHGKWTDGYTWRQPYEDDARNYTTNERDAIDESDFGYFSFGRKELYYLNKIVSREHTAFFIKDIRSDAVGKSMTYKFDNRNGSGDYIGTTGNPGDLNQSMGNSVHVKELGVNYQTEYTLSLNKIILVKNKNNNKLNAALGSNLGAKFNNYVKNDVQSINWRSPDFIENYGENYTYTLHQEDNIIDVLDYENSTIQNDVIKEVEFNHSYSLARNSSNSIQINPSNQFKGKLTLESIQLKGKKGEEFMPPYRFDYFARETNNISLDQIREDVIVKYGSENTADYRSEFYREKKKQIDNWGYFNGDEDRWSLKSIQMPTGAVIEVTYEEDDYWIEAFSRKYWEDQLEFNIESFENLNNSKARVNLGIRQDFNVIGDEIDFTNYFRINETTFLDFYVSKCWNRVIANTERSQLQTFNPELSRVLEVNSDYVQLEVIMDFGPYDQNLVNYTSVEDPISKTNAFNDDHIHSTGKKEIVCEGDATNSWNLVYKLLANKIPENEIGGGLKVTKISTTTDSGAKSYLEYNYNFPKGHEKQGRSSGITSFAPKDGLQFVPYQSELPAPGVQYQYVTLYRKDSQGNIIDYTEYRHNTLEPLYNIFSENLTLLNNDNNDTEEAIFKTTVTTNEFNNLKSKKIHVELNSGILGSLKSIKQYNNRGQLLSSVNYKYKNGKQLVDQGQGYIQESFNSLKSIFRTDNNGNNIALVNRLLSVSTKTDYNNAQFYIENNSMGYKSTIKYSNPDPVLGSYRDSETRLANNLIKLEKRIPAYEVYANLGAKSKDPSNKNMLSQKAMSITSIGEQNNLKTIFANVTTWKNNSLYDNDATATNDGIWRKHASYVYNGSLDTDGTYGLEISETNFNWDNPDSNTDWKKLSETTRYDHWSTPLEVKDINGNYTSTKMGYNNTKTIAVANAGYGEVYFSGAEDDDGQGNYGGNVDKGAGQDTNDAHTGNNALSIAANQDTYRLVVNHQGSSSKLFKVSVWAKKGTHENTRLKVGQNTIQFNAAEVVKAGNWVQLNFYAAIENGTQVSITANGGSTIVDDFRLHPIGSAMTTYVYNEYDELTYILGPNNLATQYEYDEGGRLERIYVEVQENSVNPGGFIKNREYKYQYKNMGQGNDIPDSYPPLSGNISVTNPNTTGTNIVAYVNGGSGLFEYSWSVKYCTDPNPENSAVCPGNLTPDFSAYTSNDTKYIVTECAGTRAVYWCKAKDLLTGNVIQLQGNHKRGNCGGSGGGDNPEDPINQQ
ncbi:RHS repeat domain-containing protein [Croceivirga radicis]|uniref:hypothetical protein n=1 Tax=Croceivirga radicis TaxID=1929488 RepID=UPI000255B314|nr:hypothetical protein [Croceivirga radicis]